MKARALSRGVTLLELTIVLSLLGVLATVAALAARVPPVSHTGSAEARLAGARAEALATGRAVTVVVVVDGSARAATAFPDGSVIADSELGIERLTGRVR